MSATDRLTFAMMPLPRATWRALPRLTLSADGALSVEWVFLAHGRLPPGDAPSTLLDSGATVTLARRALAVYARNLLNRRDYPGAVRSEGAPGYFVLARRSLDATLRWRFAHRAPHPRPGRDFTQALPTMAPQQAQTESAYGDVAVDLGRRKRKAELPPHVLG